MGKLTKEEKNVLQDFEEGVYQSVADKEAVGARLRAVARATAPKDRRVNIRLSGADLEGLQVLALQEGLPYQTLIASILHKYLNGRLIDRGRVA